MINKKSSYKRIILANIAEAFGNVLDRVTDKKDREKKINLEHDLCHRTIFWEADDKIVVTPYVIPSTFMNQNCRIMNFVNIKNLFPRKMAGISLSEAVMSDKYLWRTIAEIIKNNPSINFSPYAITSEFLKLSESFKKEKLIFQTSEVPQTYSKWTISYLGSKVGFRQEVLKMKNNKEKIRIPEGFICKNNQEAKEAAIWFYTNNRSCVIKVNSGEGGWGLIILKKENFNSVSVFEREIKNKFINDSIWNDEFIVVEEFIEPNPKIGGGSPSVELVITDKGPLLTYICGQIVGEGGNFLGVIVGKKLMSEQINAKLVRIGYAIGKRYWELGYRGFFDIDFVISHGEEPYAIETNARRTGGTHIFDIAKGVFGSNWNKNAYFFSQDSFEYGKRILSVEVLFKKTEHILFPVQNRQKGVIITLVSKQLPKFGFVIVAPTLLEINNLYAELCRIWRVKHNNFIMPTNN